MAACAHPLPGSRLAGKGRGPCRRGGHVHPPSKLVEGAPKDGGCVCAWDPGCVFRTLRGKLRDSLLISPSWVLLVSPHPPWYRRSLMKPALKNDLFRHQISRCESRAVSLPTTISTVYGFVGFQEREKEVAFPPGSLERGRGAGQGGSTTGRAQTGLPCRRLTLQWALW